jgi:hypothetical protein
VTQSGNATNTVNATDTFTLNSTDTKTEPKS